MCRHLSGQYLHRIHALSYTLTVPIVGRSVAVRHFRSEPFESHRIPLPLKTRKSNPAGWRYKIGCHVCSPKPYYQTESSAFIRSTRVSPSKKAIMLTGNCVTLPRFISRYTEALTVVLGGSKRCIITPYIYTLPHYLLMIRKGEQKK